jgi:hypothetical protein
MDVLGWLWWLSSQPIMSSTIGRKNTRIFVSFNCFLKEGISVNPGSG